MSTRSLTTTAADFDNVIGTDIVDEDALAKDLGVSRRSLARMHVERTGPPRIRVGRKIFYSRASVREWLLSREERQARS